MGKVYAKEITAFIEEIEGEELHISLVNQEQDNAIERIFSDILRDSEVK